ncbi:MAG: hypothetical protein IH991_19165 [Planctomycetes bacterium]|nr:hypothetical protein [Planctomycetota bacterium]
MNNHGYGVDTEQVQLIPQVLENCAEGDPTRLRDKYSPDIDRWINH